MMMQLVANRTPSTPCKTLDVLLAIHARAEEYAKIADRLDTYGMNSGDWRFRSERLFAQVRRLAGQMYPINMLT